MGLPRLARSTFVFAANLALLQVSCLGCSPRPRPVSPVELFAKERLSEISVGSRPNEQDRQIEAILAGGGAVAVHLDEVFTVLPGCRVAITPSIAVHPAEPIRLIQIGALLPLAMSRQFTSSLSLSDSPPIFDATQGECAWATHVIVGSRRGASIVFLWDGERWNMQGGHGHFASCSGAKAPGNVAKETGGCSELLSFFVHELARAPEAQAPLDVSLGCPPEFDLSWPFCRGRWKGSWECRDGGLPDPCKEHGLQTPLCGDRDLDGVRDLYDCCPDQKGVDKDGCSRADRDGDRWLDIHDLCPDQKGPAEGFGCPVADADGDGFSDKRDRCPLVAGQVGGCPDRDDDGIADDKDACPAEPENLNNFRDFDGCPDVAPPSTPPPWSTPNPP